MDLAPWRKRLARFGELATEPGRHIPQPWLGIAWAVSLVLAVGGGVLQLLTIDDWSWWLLGVFALPLVWLSLEHLPSGDGSGGVEGPYGPP